MSMFFNRTLIIPVWLVLFALFGLFAWPMPVGMGVLLLIVGIAVPAIILMLRNETPATVAAVRNHARASGKSNEKFGRVKFARFPEKDR